MEDGDGDGTDRASGNYGQLVGPYGRPANGRPARGHKLLAGVKQGWWAWAEGSTGTGDGNGHLTAAAQALAQDTAQAAARPRPTPHRHRHSHDVTRRTAAAAVRVVAVAHCTLTAHRLNYVELTSSGRYRCQSTPLCRCLGRLADRAENKATPAAYCRALNCLEYLNAALGMGVARSGPGILHDRHRARDVQKALRPALGTRPSRLMADRQLVLGSPRSGQKSRFCGGSTARLLAGASARR
eukprot:scaffold758_cov123-Isochrysis_galbana.AAC.3